MAHLDLPNGVHIEYTSAKVSGMQRCLSAQLDCTFDDVDQMRMAEEYLDALGLDDNVSLIMHVNQKVFNHAQ